MMQFKRDCRKDVVYMRTNNVGSIVPPSLKPVFRFVLRRLKGIHGRSQNKYTYWINNTFLETDWKFYSIPHRHCFMGYYDFEQIQEHKLVSLSVKKGANPKKDAAEIICFDLDSEKYQVIGHTNAWCWQQGSRLKWHTKYKNILLYNDVCDNHYISKMIDITGVRKTKSISSPLYDISSDNIFGISLNFARSERLRPGYGYSVLRDETEGDFYPKNDGLWYVDINSDERKLLISLYDLASREEEKDKYEHYINHISISPDDNKIFFLYIKKDVLSDRRITDGYIYNLQKGNYFKLNISGMSHYDWIDSDHILYAVGLGRGKVGYFVIDINSLVKEQIGKDDLKEDGHPTFIKNGFVSDTYPHNNQYQELFYYDMNKKSKETIGYFYHEPVYCHDRRCDLHPRISHTDDGIFLSCDTTCINGVRSVGVCKIKNSIITI